MGLCKYSELFGKIGEGVHSYRIFDIAIIDVIMTVISGYLLHKYLFPNISVYLVIMILFILGIVSHRLFCVRTTIDKILFN